LPREIDKKDNTDLDFGISGTNRALMRYDTPFSRSRQKYSCTQSYTKNKLVCFAFEEIW